MPRWASQVKSRVLRVQLYGAMDNIIERCGTVGMDAAQLDTLIGAELQNLCERFKDEPRATVFSKHIMAYYAPRKGMQQVPSCPCICRQTHVDAQCLGH